ncbi:uncharacterized protein ACBT57_007035 [Dama dama]
MCWQIPHSALASTNESLASSSPRCQVSTLPLRKDAAKLRGRRALPPRTTHKRSAPRATAKAGWEEWTPHLRLSGSGKHRSAPRPGSPSARCPCAPILSGNRPREPEAALSFRRRPRGARCPGRPPPKCRRSPETPPPQVRPSTEASGGQLVEMEQGKNSSNFRIVFLKAGVNIERLQIQVYTVQVNDPPVQVPLLKHLP